MTEKISLSTFNHLLYLRSRSNEYGHFYIAFVDQNTYGSRIENLVEQGLVEQLPGERTYDDWRKSFPEYHYHLTAKALNILNDPTEYVNH